MSIEGYCEISIHAPTRGATKNVLKSPVKALISIHAPTRGATMTAVDTVGALRFQSTLPREERRDMLVLMVAVYEISIHAPTRGATGFGKAQIGFILISIHAPTRGATGFQCVLYIFPCISIHAPTRGATSTLTVFFPVPCYFNPRSHERSDT